MQGHQPLDQAAQSHIQPSLECLQEWGIHNLLGNLFQCVATFCDKNFLLISKLNLPFLSLKPFFLVLSLFTLVNSRPPSCLYAPFKNWPATMRSPEPFLLQDKQAQFPQPFFIGEVRQPSDHLSGSPLDPLQQLFLILGTPDLDTVLQMVPHKSKAGQSLPCPCWPPLFQWKA